VKTNRTASRERESRGAREVPVQKRVDQAEGKKTGPVGHNDFFGPKGKKESPEKPAFAEKKAFH